MRYLPVRLLYTTVELAFNQYLADQQWLNTFRVETAQANITNRGKEEIQGKKREFEMRKDGLLPASNGLSALSCYDSMSDPPFEASTTTSKMPFMTLPGVRHWGFFSLFSCLIIKFCVASGIKFEKEFRKIYWTLHQVGLPSVSTLLVLVSLSDSITIQIQGPGRAGDLSAWDSTFGLQKSQVESERGTWWNIVVGDQLVHLKQIVGAEFFPIFFALIFAKCG